MAKLLTHADVAAILARGTFDDLIGALEAEHLECKTQPYQLDHGHQKFELAKDVSMIVNWLARHGGDGAHLLLGAKTEKSAEHHADVVTAVSPFSQSLVDPKRYYDVLQAWLLPPPEGVRVEWCPSAEDATRGIVASTIPRQPADRWPCLITKLLEADGKADGHSIAYFERRGEHGVEWTAADFQRLLREGARADFASAQSEALSQRIDALVEQVQKMSQPAAAPPPGPSQAVQSSQERRGEAITAAGLRGQPIYALTAAPVDTVGLPTLFRGPNDPLIKVLAHPPAFRHAGFDLDVRGEMVPVEGRLRRGGVPRFKLLECWPDGTLVFVVEATGFLCWGPKTRGKVARINPLALVESVYLFASLAHTVYSDHATPSPKAIRFGLALQGLQVDGLTTTLASHGINSGSFRWDLNVKQAPRDSVEFTAELAPPWTPGEAAYQLVAPMFTWFGHTEDDIPYVEEQQNGGRAISKERFLADTRE